MPLLRALRGATSIPKDSAGEVIAATAELLQVMMETNKVSREDLVSIVFTATPDITSEFPAAGARSMGLSSIPLLCAREMDVTGSLPRIIRVLMHIYTESDYASLRHIYLRDAKGLRADLAH